MLAQPFALGATGPLCLFKLAISTGFTPSKFGYSKRSMHRCKRLGRPSVITRFLNTAQRRPLGSSRRRRPPVPLPKPVPLLLGGSRKCPHRWATNGPKTPSTSTMSGGQSSRDRASTGGSAATTVPASGSADASDVGVGTLATAGGGIALALAAVDTSGPASSRVGGRSHTSAAATTMASTTAAANALRPWSHNTTALVSRSVRSRDQEPLRW